MARGSRRFHRCVQRHYPGWRSAARRVAKLLTARLTSMRARTTGRLGTAASAARRAAVGVTASVADRCFGGISQAKSREAAALLGRDTACSAAVGLP